MKFEKAPSVSTAENSTEENTITESSTPETISDKSEFEQVIDLISSTDVTVYEELNNTRTEAKDEFFQDPSLAHPRNEYGKLDAAQVAHNLEILQQVRDSLDGSDLSDKQKRLILMLCDDYYKKNDFLAANLAYNSAETPEDKAAAAEYHREANEALYGKPDEKVFTSLLMERLQKIKPENLRPEDQAHYETLLAMIGPLDGEKVERFKPKAETRARFSELANDFYGEIFDAIPAEQETFTSQEAADITNQILAENFEDSAYRAIVEPDRANAAVDHIKRQIKFPGARPRGDYSRDDLKLILAHEFGTHIFRVLPYEHHPVSVLSHELPGNETWDEGVAKCVEQAVTGKKLVPGIDHYINIGLATFKNKNFREVMEIQSMLKFLKDATPEESDEDRAARMQSIQNKLFNPVQRCFRGTGELPNNKDLAYYNGTDMVWKYIEGHLDDPELFTSLFLSGKSVATDKDQERLMYEAHVDGLQ